VLVSHRHRFIYSKTAKTAGTSVEAYFEPYCMAEGEWSPSHSRDEYESRHGIIGFRGRKRPAGCRWWSHMDAALIRQQVGEELWSSYLKFCVVRNPYDKCVSHFYFRGGRTQPADAAAGEPARFEQWLETAGPRMDRGNYLIDGKLCMDVILKYETLHADLERLCARLGIPWRPELLPRLKSGQRPPGATVDALYTPRAREIVRKAFAFELDQFGYTFPEPVSGEPQRV
jgi:hypothetical protein